MSRVVVPARPRIVACFIVLGLGLASCGTSTGVGEGAVLPAAEPTAGIATGSDPAPTPLATVGPVPTIVPPGTEAASGDASLWAAGLDVGVCFDRTDQDRPTTPFDCRDPHDDEVTARGMYPDGPSVPWPGHDELGDRGFDLLCNTAFEDFVGEPFEQVPIGSSLWHANELEWASGDRTLVCTVTPFNGEPLIGTAASGSLDSDEGIVSRLIVDGQEDFYVSLELGASNRLTPGKLDLPPLTIEIVDDGIYFSAKSEGAEAGSALYFYDDVSGLVSQVETGLPDTWEVGAPRFIAANDQIVFAARETDTDDWDLWRVDGSGTALRLTDRPGDDRWAALTPDQTQIVFHSESAGDGDIWIMDTDGSNKRQLTSGPGNDFESAVSPDGEWIAFASDRSGDDEIWLMTIDGASPTNLTRHPAADAWPAWSLNGDRLYFQTDRYGGRSYVMMMEPDGSNQSIYSFELMTNPAVVSADRAASLLGAELPIARQTIPGTPGTFVTYPSANDRIEVTVPAGWQFDEGPTEFIAAPDLDTYYSSWATDGFSVLVVDFGPGVDSERLLADTEAATGCELESETSEVDGSIATVRQRYDCGGATAIVALSVDADGTVFMLFEGQYDGDPDDASDRELLDTVLASIVWS